MLRMLRNQTQALAKGAAASLLLLSVGACELPNTVCNDDSACAEDFRCVHPGDGRAGLCKRTDEIPADVLRFLDGDLSGREGEACLPDNACNEGLVCDTNANVCVDEDGPDAPPRILRFELDAPYVDESGDPMPLIPNGTVTVSWEATEADACEIEHNGATTPVGTAGSETSVQVTAELPISLTCVRADRAATETIDGITFDENALVIGPITISPDEIFVEDTFVTVTFDVAGYIDGDTCEIELRRDPSQLAQVLVAPDANGSISEQFAVPTPGPVDVIAACSRGQSRVQRTASFVVLETPSFSVDASVFQTLGSAGAFAVDVPVTLSGATSCTFGLESEDTPLQTLSTNAQTTALTVAPVLGVADYAIECFRDATSIAREVVTIAAIEATLPTLPLSDTNTPDGFAIYSPELTVPVEAVQTLTFAGVGTIAPSCSADFDLSSVTSSGDGTATVEVNPDFSIFGDEVLINASVTCSFLDAATPPGLTVDFQLLRVSLNVTPPAEAVAGQDYVVDVEASGMTSCSLVEVAPTAAVPSTFDTQPALPVDATLRLPQLSVASQANVECDDVFGVTNAIPLNFDGVQVNMVVSEVESVSVSVDGDRNEHQYRMRLDALDALRASDRSILSCGLFDSPSSPNGRIPFDLYQTNVFFATPVTNPSQFVLDVQCRVDGETTPVGTLPIKVQLPPTSNSVALGAVDADTMILVGGLGWIGAVTPPMASQLRLVTDTLTLAEPASSTGDADAILPLLDDVGSLSPLSNDYNAEKCGIFERIADQVDETLPTNVADACDAL